MDQFRLFFSTSGPAKRRKPYLCVIFAILCLLFSQYCLKSKSPLPFEKSIPGLPHRKVNATTLYTFSQTFKTLRTTANLFSNLDFFVKSGFPKILDLSMDFPRISHPMDFPPHGFSGRPRERPTKNKIGRQGRISRLSEGSLVNGQLPSCLFGLSYQAPWAIYQPPLAEKLRN